MSVLFISKNLSTVSHPESVLWTNQVTAQALSHISWIEKMRETYWFSFGHLGFVVKESEGKVAIEGP